MIRRRSTPRAGHRTKAGVFNVDRGHEPQRRKLSHRHFCDVAGHWWECEGKAPRLGDKEPSACVCDACHAPLEQGDHSRWKNRVELVACPEHRDEERRRMEEARKAHERRAAEFGFDEKWARMKALPDGPEKHALAEDIVKWLFGGGDKRRP